MDLYVKVYRTVGSEQQTGPVIKHPDAIKLLNSPFYMAVLFLGQLFELRTPVCYLTGSGLVFKWWSEHQTKFSPIFKQHLNNGQLGDWIDFDHLSTRHVRYSDPHCCKWEVLILLFFVWYSVGLKSKLGKLNAIRNRNVLKFSFQMILSSGFKWARPFKNVTNEMAAIFNQILVSLDCFMYKHFFLYLSNSLG